MLSAKELLNFLIEQDIEFFTGVPDSQLKEFCNCLMQSLEIGKQHVIAPNEGNAVALAAGYNLATGKVGMVYMQNSGLGNAINPLTSLIDPKVYSIPLLLMIGWRGTPGIHDEPQHAKQGEITLQLLEVLGIKYTRLNTESTMEDVHKMFTEQFLPLLKDGKSAAFVVEKGAFNQGDSFCYENGYNLSREYAIQLILDCTNESDVVVSTTGKISREVYEYRDKKNQGHSKDFLTVGSMGHASMIALQISEQKPDRRIWCLDGDGAVLMHAGTLALIGSQKPKNFVHVILNNCAHESVGGLPTVATSADFTLMAQACGYRNTYKAEDKMSLLKVLDDLKYQEGPVLLEIGVSNQSRYNLGRPKTSPIQNKEEFMTFLQDRGSLK